MIQDQFAQTQHNCDLSYEIYFDFPISGIPLLITGVTSAIGRGQLVDDNPQK